MRYLIALLVFAASTGFALNTKTDPEKNKTAGIITFIENKGQVADQNFLPRPDVLFSGTDGKLVYHIKNNGISYQLSKLRSREESQKTAKALFKAGKNQDRVQVYRVDVQWMNANAHPRIQTGEPLPGYNNYYLHQCPQGVVNVKSYNGIRLKELYNGIDLHYYEKENCLKYDFIVAANKDYKQVQLKVGGAEISMEADGSLLLKTPFGTIQEGKPVAFQNGKELNAKWAVNGTILSFEIPDADPSTELVIDPPTRIWGTFYGGTGDDLGFGTATDNSGNVLMVGHTTTSGGTSIATSGGYYSNYLGGSSDGFLAKFNSNGGRIWSTYYGGTSEDLLKSVAADNSGNIYALGDTRSGNGIASPSAMQAMHGGGYDAFLVKFNSAGTRQWGTYYGSNGYDHGLSCVVESSGNIYISGSAEPAPTSSGNYFATASAHQPVFGGGTTDAFLAKFNPGGARIWGTYYGSTGNDESRACACDNKGSVYLSGITNIGSTTLITPGAHQIVSGGSNDAFLVRFDTSGVRQWATFYGGSGSDGANGCITDTTGNVYLAGFTASPGGTIIATPGSHQSIYGGGTYDGFCAKFNSSGIRQWGTYYGGTLSDHFNGCANDKSDNVYMCGQTTSTSSIASASAHQTVYGGNTSDGFALKFDQAGVRQWGTYYGGNGPDVAYDCVIDPLNNLIVTGSSISTNSIAIASPGSHKQTVPSGVNDAFLVKFDGCGVGIAGSISGTATFCGTPGSPQTYSIAPVIGATSYSWNFPSGWTGSSTTNTISITSLTVTGSLLVSASNTCGLGPVSALPIIVSPVPTISVPSGSVCSGKSFTLNPSGASTYTFSGGSAIVSPTVTTTYSITGTNTAGCVSANTATAIIGVVTTPTPSANASQSITCSNPTVTINGSGVTTYTWAGPGIVSGANSATPSVNAPGTYYLSGTTNGCSNTVTVMVNSFLVAPSIAIFVTPMPPAICAGNSATLSASSTASNYTWSTGSNAVSIVVSPTTSTNYSVSSTHPVSGCIGSDVQLITVYPLPTVTVSSSASVICGPPFPGTATLIANGASTYTWNTAATTTAIAVSPSVTTVYTVTGTDFNGCSKSALFTQSVSTCTGVDDPVMVNSDLISVFPNPTTGEFTISSSMDIDFVLTDALGKKMKDIQLNEMNDHQYTVNDLSSGVYFIIGRNNKLMIKEKIIISK